MGEVHLGILPKVFWPQKSLLLVPLSSRIILAGLLALITACPGVSYTLPLEEAFQTKHSVHLAALIQYGKHINTHRIKSKYSTRYSGHTRLNLGVLINIASLSTNPKVSKSSYLRERNIFFLIDFTEDNALGPAVCLPSTDPVPKDQGSSRTTTSSLKPLQAFLELSDFHLCASLTTVFIILTDPQ